MKKYPAYKDSGIDWIGEIPEDWEIKKISWIFNIIGSGGTPNTSKVKYYDGGIPWLNTGDLKDNFIYNTRKFVSSEAIKDHSTLRIYDADSLVIAMYGATIGKLGITRIPLCTNQACCVMSSSTSSDLMYMYYNLISVREHLISLAYGGGQPNISQTIIRNLKVPFPNISIQNRISAYLDLKTEAINRLIEEKQRLIELLIEKRQAIITQAVNKGLDDLVPMKDSGIEWIGEIPANWEITKIKYTTYVKGRIGWQGLRSDEFIDEGAYLVTGTDLIDGEVEWETCYHIGNERYNEAPQIQLREGDLLITKDGTIGKIAVVNNMPDKAILNSGLFVTRPKGDRYIPKFMYWLLNSDIFWNYFKFLERGSTIQHLYQETFVNFSYPLPEIEIQEKIVEYLDKATYDTDSILCDIKIQIEKLKEYRQSIISEVVTGKVVV